MADHSVGRIAAEQHRTAEKNVILNEGSRAAWPFLAAGDLDTAVRVLGEYAPRLDRVLEQERLYSTGGTK